MMKQIKRAIRYQLDKGNRRFVIYPFGETGMKVKDVLNQQFGITEKYAADSELCRYHSEIKSVAELEEDYKSDDFIILLSIEPLSPNSGIVHRQITKFASLDRIVDIFSISTYFIPENYYEPIQLNRDIRKSTLECISREIYKNGIKGAVAEAGVYKGNTAKYNNALFPDRKLYLFDTFHGFDQRDQRYDDDSEIHNLKLDFSDTSVEMVLEKMIWIQNVIIRKGWFPDSAKGVNDEFCCVRLDMDLYQPTKSGLEFFYPRMIHGGYICVHDCRSRNFDGARKAVEEFCKKYSLNYMNMPDDLGTAVIPVG